MSRVATGLTALSLLLLAACAVGPDYQRPAAPVAATFSEAPPAGFPGWHAAEPRDQLIRPDWWQLFGDSRLNELEARVDGNNQTLRQAEANFRAARAQVRFSRAAELPTVSVAPYAGLERLSANQPYFSRTAANTGENDFSLPLDVSYELDVWGRIRRGVTAAREQAQAAAADRETVRLALHAELAIDYFSLRSAIAQQKLLDDTVTAYQSALQLTQDRYNGAIAPLSDVAQAKTQLATARVQATDVAVQRAGYEHAIAVLVGEAPGANPLAVSPLMDAAPGLPDLPGLLPADLLERRPDVAAAERRMAAANEQIGIAKAAYFPTVSFSGAAGFMGTSLANWFTWPSRFWAVGPTVSQTLFDHGRIAATTEVARANYDGAVAGYRQSVLEAAQQVEDNLAALRVLETEADQQHAATDAAKQTLELFQNRYEGGVDTYLQVVTSQTAALQNQRNDIDLLQRRLQATVLLVKALGGGWGAGQLPATASLP
jgi:NodT family efflux transporter outer membrane factor (OMF) lipoprotein